MKKKTEINVVMTSAEAMVLPMPIGEYLKQLRHWSKKYKGDDEKIRSYRIQRSRLLKIKKLIEKEIKNHSVA